MPLTLFVRSTPPETGSARASSASSLSLTFDGARVVIGRGQGCDVRLPEPSVSARHATIRVEGGKHAVVDEGSTNGTFVREERLSPHSPHTLKSGDLLRVGRIWLEVRIDQTPATRDLANATRELAMELVGRAMAAQGDETAPRVLVVHGPNAGASVVLAEEGRAYVIGRDAASDLALTDPDASREHVQVVRRGLAVLVRDADSKNGALLGESPLSRDRDVAWRGAQTVTFGRTVLALQEPVAAALQALEESPDEPMAAGDTPLPPPVEGKKGKRKREPPPEPEPESAAPEPVPAPPERTAEPRVPRPRRSTMSATDVAIALAAIAIIVFSAAGLALLLRR